MAAVTTTTAREEREKLRWQFAFSNLFGELTSPLFFSGATIQKYIWHCLQTEKQFEHLDMGCNETKEFWKEMCVRFAFEHFLTTDEKIDAWKRADLMAETHLRFWNSNERNVA